MPVLTVDERTHQRVLDFLTRRPEPVAVVSDSEQNFVMHAPDAPLSIAEQTAADLIRFLKSVGG
ncbi:MAG TPA: hypothetical protein VG722_01885 [Tepidisphaeraceae bacterium]|nr:hypothetical protein [Tepidisphaeraceae bacterium]